MLLLSLCNDRLSRGKKDLEKEEISDGAHAGNMHKGSYALFIVGCELVRALKKVTSVFFTKKE